MRIFERSRPLMVLGATRVSKTNRDHAQYVIHHNRQWFQLTINVSRRRGGWHGAATLAHIGPHKTLENVSIARSSSSRRKTRQVIEFVALSQIQTITA